MDISGYSLTDLRRLADGYGVRLADDCGREEAVALLSAAHRAAMVKQGVADAVVAAGLVLAVAVGRSVATGAHDPEGYYMALGVSPHATEGEIKVAHRARSMLFHEDRHAGASTADQHIAKEMQQRINTAKEVLSDPRTRMAYHKQGLEGVSRAALVPANLGIQEFIATLDIMDKRDKFLRTKQELDSDGVIVARFNAEDTFLPFTERMQAFVNQFYSINTEYEEEEEYEEAAEDGSEEADDGDDGGGALGMQDVDDDDEGVADDGDSDEEEGEETASDSGTLELGVGGGGGGDGGAGKSGGSSYKLARVDMGGNQMWVLVPDEKTQKELASRVANMQAQQSAAHKHHPEPSSDQALATRGVIAAALPAPLQSLASHLPSLASLKRHLPYPDVLFHSMGFTYPISSRQLLELSSGGPPEWFRVTYSYAQSALQDFSAQVKWKVSKMMLMFSWMRHLTESWSLGLKYKMATAVSTSRWATNLQTTVRRKLPDNRELTGKLTLSAKPEDKKLSWEYKRWTALTRTTFSTTLGWLSFGGTILHHMNLPRAQEPAESYDDEDEREAAKNFGHLSMSYSQDIIQATSQLHWRVLFYTSKKSAANGIGFGVTSSLPYCHSGLMWMMADDYSARTEVQLLIKRNTFSIQIPILISTATDGPSTSFYLMAPVLIFALVKKLVVHPWQKLNRHKFFIKRRLAMKDKLWEDRRRALSEQQLVAAEAQRRLDEEQAAGGLIIVNAKYGVLHSSFTDTDDDLPPRVLDVTKALQARVQGSRLILPPGPKRTLEGFYDVDPEGEEERYLRVQYLFLEEMHEVEILESMELALPLREHRVHAE